MLLQSACEAAPPRPDAAVTDRSPLSRNHLRRALTACALTATCACTSSPAPDPPALTADTAPTELPNDPVPDAAIDDANPIDVDTSETTDNQPQWADPIPLPAPGTPVSATACVSAFVPSGVGDAEDNRRAAFFSACHALGIRAVRQHFLWHQLQPTKAKWSWDAMDRVVAAADAAKIELIGLLGYGAPWASAKGKAAGDYHFPPDNPGDFAGYAAAVTARYSKSVHRWEVWNEQNAGYRFWLGSGIDGDAKAYAELLVAARAAIAKSAPNATVAYGGLFYYPQIIPGAEQFLADTLAMVPATVKAFDALAFHPYPPYPPMLGPEDAPKAGPGSMQRYAFDVMVQRLRAIIRDAGGAHVPVWVTEVGWPIGLGLSDDQVARFLVRGYALLLREGVDLLCWYTYMDHSPNKAPSVPWEAVFGLYKWSDTGKGQPLQPKATVKAHATFFATLGQARFAADERAGKDWQQLAFADDAGRVVRVVWDWQQPEGAAREVAFVAVKGRKYSAIGMYGEDRAVTVDAAHMVRLSVSATPVYVISAPP